MYKWFNFSCNVKIDIGNHAISLALYRLLKLTVVVYVKRLCSCVYVQVRLRSSRLNRTLSSSSTACLSLRSSWATRSWMPQTSSSRRWSTSTPKSPKRMRLANTAAPRPSLTPNSLILDVVSVLAGISFILAWSNSTSVCYLAKLVYFSSSTEWVWLTRNVQLLRKLSKNTIRAKAKAGL